MGLYISFPMVGAIFGRKPTGLPDLARPVRRFRMLRMLRACQGMGGQMAFPAFLTFPPSRGEIDQCIPQAPQNASDDALWRIT